METHRAVQAAGLTVADADDDRASLSYGRHARINRMTVCQYQRTDWLTAATSTSSCRLLRLHRTALDL